MQPAGLLHTTIISSARLSPCILGVSFPGKLITIRHGNRQRLTGPFGAPLCDGSHRLQPHFIPDSPSPDLNCIRIVNLLAGISLSA
ncbi:hypothetical protein CGRA01v4_11048 [Colletotrichum graminicola]|nr:hypothetical protein CGRA01v4_11048 [Colletotrichum graminicola]